ncbi:MAG: hypothetical protein Q9185_006416 [Variospora sp. 1 TL-2023]
MRPRALVVEGVRPYNAPRHSRHLLTDCNTISSSVDDSPPEPVDKGLSNASKAGIGVGVVLGTAITYGICFLLFKRRRRQRQQKRQDPEPEKEGNALEPPPAYPYGKTAQELDAQGVAGPTFSNPQHARSQVTERARARRQP